MSWRTPTEAEKKLAKRFQRLAEDELGYRPKLMFCQHCVVSANDAGTVQGETLEERAAHMFLTHESEMRERVPTQRQGNSDD